MNETYAAWRSEFSTIQTEIDKLDELYWDAIMDDAVKLTPNEIQARDDKYNQERSDLVDKLEAHYAKTPPM